MNKFKIGDIVVGNDKSNSRYVVTNKQNGFVGEVTELFSHNKIEVKVLKCKTAHRGIYAVLENYFELANDELLTTRFTIINGKLENNTIEKEQ